MKSSLKNSPKTLADHTSTAKDTAANSLKKPKSNAIHFYPKLAEYAVDVKWTSPTQIMYASNVTAAAYAAATQTTKARHILLLESEAEDISAQTGLPIEDFANESNGHPTIHLRNEKARRRMLLFKRQQMHHL